MANSGTTPVRTRLHSYTGYTISCAAVWAVILGVAQRRLDPDTGKALQLWCAAWWSGWTSATIARAGYPPPKKLTPRTEKWFEIVSPVLVALGLGNVIHLLATRRPVGRRTTDTSRQKQTR
jgi:hypothetical protein